MKNIYITRVIKNEVCGITEEKTGISDDISTSKL